jgi:protocatechuate 3,4-dioxygenase beta subunit
MGDSKKRWPVMRVLAAFIGLCVLAWLVLLGGYWQAMAPTPDTVEPERRTPTVRTVSIAEEPEEASPDGPFEVSGRVLDADGGPLANEPILWFAAAEGPESPELGTTGPDGSFRVTVDDVGFLRPTTKVMPERVHVHTHLDDVEFRRLARCPIEVEVLDPNGQPIVDQDVRARVQVEHRDDQPYLKVQTDDRGIATLATMPCGVARVWVRRTGYPQGRRENIDTLVDQHVVIRLVEGVSVSGIVTDPDGQPIDGARVHSGNASDETDATGQYGLIVDPRNLSRVDVSAEGYESTSERLRVAASDASDALVELDFVLYPARMVAVFCAGLPADSCESILPLMCTHPMLPMGSQCSGDPTECRCPEGRAAIRGAGMAVEVEEDDTEVWLDLRNRGGLRGTVLIGGRPVDPSLGQCMVLVNRLPTALEDIPGGMSAGAKGSCLPDGQFQLEGLKAGNYMVMVHTSAGEGNLPMVAVNSGITDVGTIDIGGGGRIEGVVLDGTTGEGLPGQAVVAYAGTDQSLSGLGQTVSGTEGRFVISGLQDGDYQVILATRPLHTHSVTVSDGTADSLELTTGDAGLLAKNGFELETDDEGQLVVGAVDDESGAARGGLEEGDVVVGVTIGGVNVGEMMPSMADEVTDAVLDHWGGPGVGLVVEREGEQVTVPLE